MEQKTSASQEEILEALKVVKDPDLGRDIVSLGFIKNVKSCGGSVSITIELTTPACPVKEQMKEEARRALLALPEIQKVDITMTAQVRPNISQSKNRLLPQVANIVPVASGKGGVGKSTVAANLAISLAKLGARVGLADMDVYGPSIPTLMTAHTPPKKIGERMAPAVSHGVKMISMGFFLPKDKAAIWRGPMLHKTVEQFLGAVDWGELDYLIVDLPPGTGDIQLSLCQIIPLTGAVVVSTPQDVALNIAEKAMLMFQQLRTPVLGLVENMSGFACSHCGNREEIFGSGGTRKYSAEHNIPFLGEIPLSTDIRKASDAGDPLVVSSPESPSAQAFMIVAKNVAAQISVRNQGEQNSDAPVPAKIDQPTPDQIRIAWKEGHLSKYSARSLRLNCSCAQCVDENTGEKRIKDGSVPQDVRPLNWNTVGQYALHFSWSDGHTSGIYTYDHLRSLCPCESCSKAKTKTA